MELSLKNLSHGAQRKTLSTLIDRVLKQDGDAREKAFLQILDIAKTFYGKNLSPESYEKARNLITDHNNK